MKFDYLTIDETGNLKLHGFEMIKDFVYVETIQQGKFLLFTAREKKETYSRFRVKVNDERIIDDERVIAIVKNNNIENKWFAPDFNLKNYLSTPYSI